MIIPILLKIYHVQICTVYVTMYRYKIVMKIEFVQTFIKIQIL